MSLVCDRTKPYLSFKEPEHYGDGISVHEIDFSSRQIDAPFKSTYFQVLPGFTTPVDQHKVQECWIVLRGTGVLESDGVKNSLMPNDIVHFPSFVGHSVTNNGTEPLLLCSIYW